VLCRISQVSDESYDIPVFELLTGFLLKFAEMLGKRAVCSREARMVSQCQRESFKGVMKALDCFVRTRACVRGKFAATILQLETGHLEAADDRVG
jgi:hypothetical protein